MGQPRGHHYHFETCAAPCGALRAVYVLPFALEKSRGALERGSDRQGRKMDAKCTYCCIDTWTNDQMSMSESFTCTNLHER